MNAMKKRIAPAQAVLISDSLPEGVRNVLKVLVPNNIVVLSSKHPLLSTTSYLPKVDHKYLVSVLNEQRATFLVSYSEKALSVMDIQSCIEYLLIGKASLGSKKFGI